MEAPPRVPSPTTSTHVAFQGDPFLSDSDPDYSDTDKATASLANERFQDSVRIDRDKPNKSALDLRRASSPSKTLSRRASDPVILEPRKEPENRKKSHDPVPLYDQPKLIRQRSRFRLRTSNPEAPRMEDLEYVEEGKLHRNRKHFNDRMSAVLKEAWESRDDRSNVSGEDIEALVFQVCREETERLFKTQRNVSARMLNLCKDERQQQMLEILQTSGRILEPLIDRLWIYRSALEKFHEKENVKSLESEKLYKILFDLTQFEEFEEEGQIVEKDKRIVEKGKRIQQFLSSLNIAFLAAKRDKFIRQLMEQVMGQDHSLLLQVLEKWAGSMDTLGEDLAGLVQKSVDDVLYVKNVVYQQHDWPFYPEEASPEVSRKANRKSLPTNVFTPGKNPLQRLDFHQVLRSFYADGNSLYQIYINHKQWDPPELEGELTDHQGVFFLSLFRALHSVGIDSASTQDEINSAVEKMKEYERIYDRNIWTDAFRSNSKVWSFFEKDERFNRRALTECLVSLPWNIFNKPDMDQTVPKEALLGLMSLDPRSWKRKSQEEKLLALGKILSNKKKFISDLLGEELDASTDPILYGIQQQREWDKNKLSSCLEELKWKDVSFSSERTVGNVQNLFSVLGIDQDEWKQSNVKDRLYLLLPHVNQLNKVLEKWLHWDKKSTENTLSEVREMALKRKMHEIRQLIPETFRVLSMGSNTSYMIAYGVIKGLYPDLYVPPIVSKIQSGIALYVETENPTTFKVSLIRGVLYSRTSDQDPVGKPIASIPFEWTTTCVNGTVERGALRPASEPNVQRGASYEDKWLIRDALRKYSKKPDIAGVGLQGGEMNSIQLKKHIRYSLALSGLDLIHQQSESESSESSD